MFVIHFKKGLSIYSGGKKHIFFFLEDLYKVPLHHLLTLQIMQEGIVFSKNYSGFEMCVVQWEKAQIIVIWYWL